MVKLTATLVSQKVSQNRLVRKVDKKDKEAILRSVTHIKLHNNFIHEIGDISKCKNVKVMYLHNNCIDRIDNLQHAINLTHLYLQKNKITKIENLGGLQKLKKLLPIYKNENEDIANHGTVSPKPSTSAEVFSPESVKPYPKAPPRLTTKEGKRKATIYTGKRVNKKYIGQNFITVLEGLENLINLEELHIEKQNLPPGESLYFDPRTMSSLTMCLKFLNTSGNKLTSISDLAALKALQTLVAQDNYLKDMSDVTQTLKQWPFIANIDLQGNPVTLEKKYKDYITISSPPSLVCIDGKEVMENTRIFLKRLEWIKTNRPVSKKTAGPSGATATVADNLAGLAKQLPAGVRHTLSQAVLTSSGVLGNFPSSVSAMPTGTSVSKRKTCTKVDGEKKGTTTLTFLHHTIFGQSDGISSQQYLSDNPNILHLTKH